MCVLAHVLEQAGLATVVFSSIRSITERMHPPRALHCDFPLGRPLGKVGDIEFQRSVLMAGLALLDAGDVPVFADYPVVLDEVDPDAEPMTCTIPPRFNPNMPVEVDEALGYLSAYKRHAAKSNHTLVGLAVHAEQIPQAIELFIVIANGGPWRELPMPGHLNADPQTHIISLALDIRAYYEEAALEIINHVPEARATQAWFFGRTKSGDLLLRAKRRLIADDEPYKIYSNIAPITAEDMLGQLPQDG